MDILLPPIVVGPVTVLDKKVQVDGPLTGAVVTVFVNGIARWNASATSTTTFVSVTGGLLKVGDGLTAQWTMDGATSPPSPVPVSVLGLPTHLAPLLYLSHVHVCVDWIVFGGAFPGATIEVSQSGTVLGSAVATSTSVSVRITKPITAGNILTAIQSLTTSTGTIKSSATPSLPADPTPFPEAMPAPWIGPVSSCADSVPIYGIAMGATTHLKYNGNEMGEFHYVGPSFNALLGQEAHKPDTFSAAQNFERCGHSSPFSAPNAFVDDTLPVPKPMVNAKFGEGEIFCPAAKAIMISNLISGAVLTIKIIQPTGAIQTLGKIGVGKGKHYDQIWIPDITELTPITPPDATLIVVQEYCGKSSTSDGVFLRTPYQGTIFPPTVYPPPVECVTGVRVAAARGSVLRVYSDRPDSPVISQPVFTLDEATWVTLDRALFGGENIHVELESTCQSSALRIGPPVQVEALTLTIPNIVPPVRAYQRRIYVTNTTMGATVHAFVNGTWRAQTLATNYGSFVVIDVGPLTAEDDVTVLQTLCTKISDQSPPVHVTPGVLVLSAIPPTLIHGEATSLTIKSTDFDTTLPVAGTISMGGSVIGATNMPLLLTPPSGGTELNLLVVAAGYSAETISIPITSPPIAVPAVLTIVTGLIFNASKRSITDLTWNLLGTSSSYSKTAQPNVDPASTQFTLPQPTAGAVPFTLSCTVKFEFEGFNGYSGSGSANIIQGGALKPTPSTMEFWWSGVDSTLTFEVEYLSESDIFVLNPY